jgi:ribosome-associated protein
MISSNSSLKNIHVKITDLPIRLGQFLKYAGIAENGLEAKKMILDGKVSVNGVVELRRGRQIGNEDQVTIGEVLYRIDRHE